MTLEEAKEVLRPLIAMMTDQWGCPISDVPIALEVLLNKVDAEPVRHGHWEFIGGYGYQYRCSNCIMCAEHRTNYCPHCGAKMNEVNDV